MIVRTQATIEQNLLINAIPDHGCIHAWSRYITVLAYPGCASGSIQFFPGLCCGAIRPEIIEQITLVIDTTKNEQQIVLGVPDHAMV